MMRNNLQAFVAISLAALLAVGPLTPTAEARNKKGDKLQKEAQAAEARNQWAKAADLYNQAVDEDPKDSGYIIGMRRARQQAAMEYVQSARDLRTAGKMAEALAELQRAILMDPSLPIALQELKRTQDMLKAPAAPGEANLTPYERALKDAEERSASLLGVPELVPPVKRVDAIKMNNAKPTQVYNIVAAIAQINVVYDSTWTGRQGAPGVDLDIPAGMSTRQALEYVATVTRTYWKPLTPTTIFVTEDTANKRRDFADQVTKVIFVTNTASQPEFNEIQTAVRTITDIRRVYPHAAQKAIVVRGDVDAVALAEKLVRDLDRPKSEVVIDVIIMEANSSRTRDLAATLASLTSAGLSPGLDLSATFAPRPGIARGGAGANAGTQIGLNNLGRLSTADFTTSLGGALLNAMLADSRTRIISNPQVRASEGQEARLAIGDQVPVAQGNFQTGTTGTSGVGVNTTYQYRDVGTIVRLTPTSIHSNSEVTLQVDFEISTLKDSIEVGGIQAPVFGSNKSTANLRLREGEVSILAGLTRDQGSELNSGFPGLIDIPVLGKFLFGSNHKEQDRGEIMIAMIPHIIRTPDYSPENIRSVFTGTDQLLVVRHTGEEGEGGPSAGPEPRATTPQAAAPKPAEGMRIAFDPSPVTANVSAPFTVNVQLENAADAFSAAPLRITWDPKVLRLSDMAPGELLSRNGGRVTSVKDIRNDTGRADLTITRAGGSGGVSGTGTLATLTFVGLASGSDRITVTEVNLHDPQNGTPAVAVSSVPVTIR
jgi:general secretion pathway protein D